MDIGEDFWDDILGHLKQRVLVPVVGPDLLAVADAGRTLPVYRLLGERLAERYKLPFEWTDRASLHDVVRALLVVGRRDEGERLYRVVNDLLLAANPAPPEALRQLAQIRDFQLFVTTTFDSLLTRAIDAIRFSGTRGTRELWFAPNQSTAEQQKNARPPAADEAVVFKLFGQASSISQYALNEEDVLEWLHALLTETARLPEWLSSQLREGPLLFIGCRIPDWLGRFLVRMTSRTRLSLASKQFFIVGSAASREPMLADFFATYCGATRVQVREADPAEFVAELQRRWVAANPGMVTADAPLQPLAPARGGIFISYVREDAAAARVLADAITTLGGDVWLDERRLQPGDQWEEEILVAIRRQVRLFVPMISRNTELREEGYVFREWAEALKRSGAILRRRFILPVVIDPEYDGNPGRYLQVQENMRSFQFGHAAGGQPSAALVSSLTEEIRAMRRKEVA